MSWGIDVRNSVAIGLGGVVSLFSGDGNSNAQSNLLTEGGNNLTQENGSLILV